MAGIVLIGNENMIGAVYCVSIALFLDFLDGFVARLLGVQSELGVQLDSLADGITFGALPGLILFQMIVICEGAYFVDSTQWPLDVWINACIASCMT